MVDYQFGRTPDRHGIFRVVPAQVENSILVARTMAGEPDLPDFKGWCDQVRGRAPSLYPSEVRLVAYAGGRRVVGFNGRINGKLG